MWLNQNGTANILNIPQLEEEGYYGTYKNLGYWIVHSSNGIQVKFSRDVFV